VIDPERQARVALAMMRLEKAGQALEHLDPEDLQEIERMCEGRYTLARLKKEVREHYCRLGGEGA
jgi:hypothetical protein